MIYVIIGAVAAFVLLLLFWDDHDSAYDRGDGRSRYSRKAKEKPSQGSGQGWSQAQNQQSSWQSQNQARQPQQEAPRAEFKSEPKVEFGSGPKRERNSEAKTETKSTAWGPKENVKDTVINVVESIIKEVKEQNADSLKAMQQDVRKAFDEARTAFNDAMKGAGQRSYWAGSAEDVDEQEPLEEGERYDDEAKTDLSFLDSLYYYEHLQENTETFDIAGLTYHCTVLDRGPIVGYVKPEPTNPHDSRAQAVYRYDGKLLGYIPRKQQDWYEDFNQQNVVCPFVGEITVDRRGWMTAEIKAIIPVNKSYVQEEIEAGL